MGPSVKFSNTKMNSWNRILFQEKGRLISKWCPIGSKVFHFVASKKGRYTHEIRAETINNSKNYWSNKEEPSTKKPRVEEAASTVEIIPTSVPVNQPSGSDVKERTDAYTSQKSACSRSSSIPPGTCPFSSSTSSTSTSFDVVDDDNGHQTLSQGKPTEMPISVPVNQSFDSDVKEVTDASTSQESACSRSSSATPETLPFSSSSSSTSTSVQAVNFVSGHQTQGEYDVVSPVVVESPGTSKESSTDDVMTEFCSLHEELQTICPGMSTELESLNKSMTGNESMCPSRVDYNLRSVHTVWQRLRQWQENVAITIGFHCI